MAIPVTLVSSGGAPVTLVDALGAIASVAGGGANISSVAGTLVKGTAPAGSTVTVTVDGATAFTTTADALGQWSGNLPSPANGGQVVAATSSVNSAYVVPGAIGLPTSVTTLNAMGDSITNNVAASNSANGWVAKLAAYLGAVATNNGINGTVVQNRNDSGGSPRADNMLSRYAANMTGGNKKELGIIAGGLNDARYTAAPATMNVANFIIDYRSMLTGLFNAGYPMNRLVLVTPHWIPEAGFSQGTAGFTGQTRAGYELYVKAVRDLAKEFGCYLADSYNAMKAAASAGQSIMDADNIHPNDAGHEVIFQAVKSATLQVQNAYVYDSFAAADGTAINARSGEIGSPSWTFVFGFSPGVPAPQIQSNRAYNTALSSVYGASGTPGAADYEVVATFACLSVIANENVGIYGRGTTVNVDTRYWGRYMQGTGWQLFKTVGGTSTQLGATSATLSLTAGVSRRVMLRMVGTTISLWVDGQQLVSVTDSDITAAGNAGMRLATAKTSTTGIHVDDILARPITPLAA